MPGTGHPSFGAGPDSVLFVPHTRGSGVSVVASPLSSRAALLPLTSKFLVRILGESHPVSFRAEDKATAHNRVVSGSENPHSWGAVNQALGDGFETGVLGNPAF